MQDLILPPPGRTGCLKGLIKTSLSQYTYHDTSNIFASQSSCCVHKKNVASPKAGPYPKMPATSPTPMPKRNKKRW
ncbi:hypothetical protein HBI17_153090 [Parastagonospora nodorum]|nr:hypothetical protein HBH46_093730 [Parastagonospora nodorum]KAH4216094.1 hypothetical protein HBI06_236110 [Parastagonospora nodorum]KAH4232489.1 hypothetical protein HBI05_173350 [Parastagonospora nodorum]KAH4916546.1 hypothetical protein HBH74_141330 [Parastagonospora nodorum]KAH4927528.1 hypothetical protein HBH73_202190 [Parastagonospora nodorum]